ncbi:unnamed protein product [Larinioides sclopetarius]|uniref:Translation initiation factor 1 n=1 Tax=Larinioides sclopetarius TaxID=280406 RepID=A0AAV1ZE86_9ARAC
MIDSFAYSFPSETPGRGTVLYLRHKIFVTHVDTPTRNGAF